MEMQPFHAATGFFVKLNKCDCTRLACNVAVQQKLKAGRDYIYLIFLSISSYSPRFGCSTHHGNWREYGYLIPLYVFLNADIMTKDDIVYVCKRVWRISSLRAHYVLK